MGSLISQSIKKPDGGQKSRFIVREDLKVPPFSQAIYKGSSFIISRANVPRFFGFRGHFPNNQLKILSLYIFTKCNDNYNSKNNDNNITNSNDDSNKNDDSNNRASIKDGHWLAAIFWWSKFN